MIPGYEQNLRRLEAIVADLGNDAKPLSDAVLLFEEGMGCLREATAQLSDIEAKVKVLIEQSDGAIVERDL